jgi:hypothetical protein
MRNQYLVKTACPRVAALTHQYLELGLPLNSALRAAEADLWEPENLGLVIQSGPSWYERQDYRARLSSSIF